MEESKQNSTEEINVEYGPMYCKGFDDCIMGEAIVHGNDVVVYSMKKMIQTLMKNDGMSLEEAEEFLIHNTWYAYMGIFTPVYFDDTEDMNEL
jgi:hypothetical protein